MRYATNLLGSSKRTFIFAAVFGNFMGRCLSKMSSSTYPTVHASEKQTASVIFLHGLGDTGHGWCAGFDDIKAPHIKYHFPNAPTQRVTLNAGMAMPSWFDIKSLSFDGPEDSDGIARSSTVLQELVEQEVKNGIPINRIVIGGFSQGGAVALHTAFTTAKEFGGVLALSTWLPLHKELEKTTPCSGLNILQCHGNADPVVNYAFGQMTAALLKTRYPNHTFNTYDKMGHSSSTREMEDVKAFIAKVLPEV